MDTDSEVVWVKSAAGAWGLGQVVGQVAVCPGRPGPDRVSQNRAGPAVPKPAPKPKRGRRPAAKPAAAGVSISVADGQHGRQFKTMRDHKRTLYTVPAQQ